MPRTFGALLLSSAVMIASLDSAWSAPTTASSPSAAGRQTASPLPPGGPAGIRQAQGTDWSGPLLGAAVAGGIFLALLLLIDEDATGPVTSTAP
jgi:hypothetical protein